MNPFEYEEMMAEGDGYSNEFSRAAAAFREAYRFKDNRAEGRARCSKDGLFRVAVGSPVYGPCDEIAGMDWRMLPHSFLSREEVYDWMNRNMNPAFWDDCNTDVIGPEVLGPPLPPAPVEDDSVPF